MSTCGQQAKLVANSLGRDLNVQIDIQWRLGWKLEEMRGEIEQARGMVIVMGGILDIFTGNKVVRQSYICFMEEIRLYHFGCGVQSSDGWRQRSS